MRYCVVIFQKNTIIVEKLSTNKMYNFIVYVYRLVYLITYSNNKIKRILIKENFVFFKALSSNFNTIDVTPLNNYALKYL